MAAAGNRQFAFPSSVNPPRTLADYHAHAGVFREAPIRREAQVLVCPKLLLPNPDLEEVRHY